jgi:hypothetical protein
MLPLAASELWNRLDAGSIGTLKKDIETCNRDREELRDRVQSLEQTRTDTE